jgi:MerR family transcriptional regulator, Zn(II)-responsive regulator of zntA
MANRDLRGPLRSGELAARTGVSADTLRSYERRGLLPPATRSSNGYRLYPPEAVARVELIQAGLAFGFTLSELGRFLGARRAGSPPCREVRDAARARLCEIEEAVAELQELREALARLVAEWDKRLEGAGASPRRPLGLLETLPRSAVRRAGASVSARRFSRSPGSRGRTRKEES